MKETVAQMELEMPQLRQMVLENTERINKNELVIDKMRMEAAEQTRKISERDEWLENFRRENDRSMRESKERMDRLEKFAEASKIEQERLSREIKEQLKENSAQMKESREDFDRQMKESREDFDRQMKESREAFDKRMKESDEAFDKRMKESDEAFDKRMKETDRRIEESRKETDKQIKEMFAETNATIRRVSVEFLGVTGHMVEGLVSSSVEKIFKEAGFDLHDSGKNLKRELPLDNRQMEVDAMLSNESVVVPVEVKEHFTKRKVKRWLHKMETFREFFPECADKEVLAAVAAINYEAGAAELAHEEGLLVIRVSSEDIFSLDPVDKEKLRRF